MKGFRGQSVAFSPDGHFATADNGGVKFWKTEFGSDNGEFLRQEIVLGKKVPVKRWHIAPMLEFGVIVEKDDKYSGPLANPAIDEVTLVFRPNIDW